MDEPLTAAICEIIREVYGDATTSVLDRRCAERIVRHMETIGATPTIVRAIIASVGGKVDVQEKYLVDPPRFLTSYRRDDDTWRLQTSKSALTGLRETD